MFLWWQKASPARRAQVLCALAALIVITILVLTPKPWSFDLATAKKIKLPDYVRVYSWWAGLINLLPCAPQFSKYLSDATHAPLESFWLKNVGSLLVTGSHWSKSGRLDFRYPEFNRAFIY